MFPIIGLEWKKAIVQEYGKIFVFHVRIYHHLHPLSMLTKLLMKIAIWTFLK
jgi:hypothetical protein